MELLHRTGVLCQFLNMKCPDGVQVFQYRDYRAYLADVYSARKATEYGFSYRSFARRARLRAPNYLKLVTSGDRNLSPEMAHRFAAALGLEGNEASYFCDLVAFNQARSAEERDRNYQRLQGYKQYREAFHLDAAHAAYYSQWYIPAIRELVTIQGFRDDPKWIATALRPRITRAQAATALSVLQELGLLTQSGGTWTQQDPLVANSEEVVFRHHLAHFHRAMLTKASDAIDRFPREERELGALTLAVDKSLLGWFKTRIAELREEFLQRSLAPERSPDRVVQINFQLFPLSVPSEAKRGSARAEVTRDARC